VLCWHSHVVGVCKGTMRVQKLLPLNGVQEGDYTVDGKRGRKTRSSGMWKGGGELTCKEGGKLKKENK
jgi:hypothetical protein